MLQIDLAVIPEFFIIPCRKVIDIEMVYLRIRGLVVESYPALFREGHDGESLDATERLSLRLHHTLCESGASGRWRRQRQGQVGQDVCGRSRLWRGLW